MRQLVDALEMIGLMDAKSELAAAGCEPVTPESLGETLTQLAWTLGPAYLPFAEWQASWFCLHLRPGIPIWDSPVVYCDHDPREARFVTRSVADFPRGLWLWNAQWQRDEDEFQRFVMGIRALVPRIPGARDLPPEFLQFQDLLVSRWTADPAIDALWVTGDVGHPMAGLPAVHDRMKPDEAAVALGPFLRARESKWPELRALRIGLDHLRGAPVDVRDCLEVLRAECWQASDFVVPASSFVMLEPMAAWRKILEKCLEGQRDALLATPFAPLATHPKAYSGKDDEGAELIHQVATRFRADGEKTLTFNQLRNAAQLSMITHQSIPEGWFDDLAQACDAIEPGGLATELTLAYANARKCAP